ncbi:MULTISPECIES: ABC transporter permease [unclassified Chelatococcus]|uniref:ABC transporter permease n=1 Tax=unclassified Chelatococcus TaxID=2638111 RepID=UPI0020BE29D7|nr:MULTISPECIES: ABC transporter permease [unclassified Chelatococcus]CAH1653627.1 putative spermidine/putrescine transport system permease protein [Hyphomicrobiales bacterium]CAH1694531.1 putative spermidine/putrescine transport system permease protein [Hyphomicrobiales bacterium]
MSAVGAASRRAPSAGLARIQARVGRLAFSAAVLLCYLLIFLPVLFVVLISFFRAEMVSFPPDGFSLRWYANAWSHGDFLKSLLTSLQVATLSTIVGVIAGTLAAFGLRRSNIRFKPLFNMLFLGPLLLPGVVGGAAIYMGYFRAEAALDRDITGSLWGLVAAHIMLTIPWSVRLVMASLAQFNPATEEAAADLGASGWTIFRRITLPALRPGIVAACMFSFIASFENLEISMFLVGPGRSTLPVAMLSYLEYRMDPTLAAVATAQILLVGVLMLITDRYVKLSRVV